MNGSQSRTTNELSFEHRILFKAFIKRYNTAGKNII